MIDQNRRGITLVEIVVALMAASLFCLVLAQIYTWINRDMKASMEQVDRMNAVFLGQKRLVQDLQKVGPSFSGIRISDCDDDSTLASQYRRFFFDYSPTGTNVERKLVLAPDPDQVDDCINAKSEIILLIVDSSPDATQRYAPKYAYKGWYDTPPTLEYAGLNFNSPKIGQPSLDYLAPGFWQQGAAYSLESPFPIPELDDTGSPYAGMNTSPGRFRSLFYVGVAVGVDLVPLSGQPQINSYVDSVTTDGMIRTDHPQRTYITCPTGGQGAPADANIGSADKFFRALQPMGEQMAFALLKRVHIVRYRLATENAGTSPRTVMKRSEWVLPFGGTGHWGQDELVMDGIKELRLYRPQISVLSLDFEIIKDK